MLKVKVSDEPDIHIPTYLSKQLGLAEGDQVEFARLGHLIALRKLHNVSRPHSLRHLAGVVKSSRPKASVDVAQYMTQRGYESLDTQVHPVRKEAPSLAPVTEHGLRFSRRIYSNSVTKPYFIRFGRNRSRVL